MARTAVVAGTATAASNRVSRRQAQKWSNQDTQNQPAEPMPQQANGSDDAMDQLKKLGELHDQGILTDEEFATKKQEILNRI
jgi:hypothetical protein